MAHGSELNALIEAICQSLFGREDHRIDQQIEKLNRENDLKHGHAAVGFLLQGQYFRPKSAPPSKDREMLHIDLIDEGLAFIDAKRNVDADRRRIKQSLYRLLRDCTTPQDIRDALPDCIIEHMAQSVRDLPRTRPEAYTIREDERAQRQLQTVKETIEFYSVARLLY